MTKEEFLAWAKQYKNTHDIRGVVERMYFKPEELDYMKAQMEPNVERYAESKELARSRGA
jgi:biotin synthase-related radical SAM superfamily protein